MTAATTAPTLPAALAEAVDAVRIDPADWSARVAGRELEGGSPRELRPQLIGAMYEVLHAGRTEEKDLGRIGREAEVEDVLAAAVPHATSPRAGRVLAHHDDGSTRVDLGGVRVRVPAEHAPRETPVGEVAVMALPAVRPALSHGFYLLDGPHGGPDPRAGLRRLYVHATTPEAAAAAWRPVLTVLGEAGVGFRSKALSHRDGYPRRDAVVVYLPLAAAGLTDRLAAAVQDVEGLAPETSAFAHRLAPGVAVADDPRDPRPQYRDLSFGEHRCAVLAAALMQHAEDPNADLADLFARECRAAGVDPTAPAFNATPETDAHPTPAAPGGAA